jgi:hypothetical protein
MATPLTDLRPGLLAVLDMLTEMHAQSMAPDGEEESWVARGARATRNDLVRRIERALMPGDGGAS